MAIVLFNLNIAFGQESVVTSGGETSGPGGSSSFSIGQTVFSNNSSASGNENQGVQQPYEIFIVSGLNETDIDLSFQVFPNPTVNMLTLSVAHLDSQEFEYVVLDANGKQIRSLSKLETTNTIDLEKDAPGIYFIHIRKNNIKVKTYKILKK